MSLPSQNSEKNRTSIKKHSDPHHGSHESAINGHSSSPTTPARKASIVASGKKLMGASVDSCLISQGYQPSNSSASKTALNCLPKASKIPNSAYYNVTTKTFWPRKPIRPVTPDYLVRAGVTPKRLDKPHQHLVILDLNGTLFYRSRTPRRTITMRPYLPEFLKFLFDNFRVMVWSSATPPSVETMLQVGLGQFINRLDRVWTRQDFDLDEIDYNRKVLTLKDLEIVWRRVGEERIKALKKLESDAIGQTSAEKKTLPDIYAMEYDQTNTILIDDSYDKSQLQKHNCIVLADFDQARARAGDDVELLKVMNYLRKLAYQENVSAYMRLYPFNSESESIECSDKVTMEADALSESINRLANALESTTLVGPKDPSK